MAPKYPNPLITGKARKALRMISSKPELWFKDTTIDERDKALLSARPVRFVDYEKGSFLRKIYHMKVGEDFKQTEWFVETDNECKKLIHSAGAGVVGFELGKPDVASWASKIINVNIQTPAKTGIGWGFLSTDPSNCRLFGGPPESCPSHAWDAMILRDCTPNTGSFWSTDEIASRKWDILVMKMCEDYDHPWVVVAVKDAGVCPEPKVCNLP